MFLENLQKIQDETFLLNEGDESEDSKNTDTDKENKSDSSSDTGDIDALLKDTSSSEDNKDGGSKDENSKDDELDSIPDFNADDGKDSGLDDLNLDDTSSKGSSDDNSDSGDVKNFETDSEGLLDTITKLAKSGHKVTINITSEGKQVFTYNNKKVSPKEIRTLAEIVLPKPKETKEMKMMKSLMEQINSLKKEIKNNKSGNIKPIQETKFIKISQDNYDTLTEMVTDLKFKLDEAESVIENYKTTMGLLEENSTEDLNYIFTDLQEGIDAVNELSNNKVRPLQYTNSTSNTIEIMQEDVIPMLTSLSELKNSIASSFDNSYINNIDINGVLKTLDEANNNLASINKLDKFKSLVESKLSSVSNKSQIMNILSEATSDIIAFDGDYGYPQDYPKYDGFAKRVQDTINKAAAGVNMSNSKIINYQPDTSDNLMSRSNVKKFDIPIARPNSIPGFDNDKITVRSAIMNLNEALVDIDGKLNLPLCEKAFLYKKVKNPTSLKDFAFPIAISENNQLVAVPKLIETVSNILKNDSCIKTYGIDSRETFYALRESIEPLMKECEISIPWKDETLLTEAKKKVAEKEGKKKVKKVKCKECGRKFDPEELDKDGLCKECAKLVKKNKK